MKPIEPIDDGALQRGLEEAVSLLNARRAGAAVDILRELNRRRPGHFDVVHVLGAAQVLDGRSSDGIRHLRQAVALNPAAAGAWTNLGGALETAGDVAGAIDVYGAALRAVPNLSQASIRLCVLLIGQGKVEEAAAQAERFVAEHPENVFANLAAGHVRERQGRVDEAVASYRRTLELAPFNAVARERLEALTKPAGHA